MPELTLEQKQAIARAKARKRAGLQENERSSYNINAAVGPGVRIPESSIQEATRPSRTWEEQKQILVDSFTPDRPREEQGFVERSFGDIAQRMGPDLAEQLERDQSATHDIVQFAGKQLAGSALDTIGEAVITAARGAAHIPGVEESIDQYLPQAQEAWQIFSQTDAGKKAIEAAQAGIERWEEFKKEDPATAASLEAAGNIALLAFPVKPRASRGSSDTVGWLRGYLLGGPNKIEKTGPLSNMVGGGKPRPKDQSMLRIGAIGQQLRQSGVKASVANKRKFVEDLIEPVHLTDDAKVARVSRTERQPGIVGRQTAKPTAAEEETIKELMNLGLKPKNTLVQNTQIIEKAVERMAERLANSLQGLLRRPPPKGGGGRPGTYSPDELTGMLEGSAKLAKTEPVAQGTEAVIDAVYANFLKAMDGVKPTLANLLRARKQFDKLNQATLKRFAARQQGAVQNETTMNVAVLQLRQDINEFIAARAPTSAMRESLRRQSALLRGQKEVGLKAAAEAKTSFGRAFQKIIKKFKLRDTSLQIASAAFIGGQVAGRLMESPALMWAGAVPATLFLGYRAVAAPKTRKYLGSFLKELDRTIANTTDIHTLRQLRMDRAALVEMMKNMDSEEKE